MKAFQTVEEAYEIIANAVIKFPSQRTWHKALGKFELLEGMVSVRWAIEVDGILDEKGRAPPEPLSDLAMDAAMFLQGDLFKKTSNRIWGLTFTLFPSGKFKIEYDYNKPEGYEESDETFDLDQTVDRLQKLGVNVEVSGKKN